MVNAVLKTVEVIFSDGQNNPEYGLIMVIVRVYLIVIHKGMKLFHQSPCPLLIYGEIFLKLVYDYYWKHFAVSLVEMPGRKIFPQIILVRCVCMHGGGCEPYVVYRTFDSVSNTTGEGCHPAVSSVHT